VVQGDQKSWEDVGKDVLEIDSNQCPSEFSDAIDDVEAKI